MTGLALSRDGKVLAVAAGGLQLWSTTTGQRTGGTLPAADAGGPVAISPDGSLVAAIGTDGKARLYQVATQQETGTAVTVGPGATVYAVAFSPDGTTLASAHGDGTARLWDAATQQEIGTPMTAGPGPVYAVAFSPDGTTLITADASNSSNGRARQWDVAFPAGLPTAACAIADQSLTRPQWADYAGTQPFQQVCSAS